MEWLMQPHRSLQRQLLLGKGKTFTQLAQDVGVTGSYLTRVLRLSFFASEILKVIQNDRHTIDLSSMRPANDTRLPVAWDAQRALHGLA